MIQSPPQPDALLGWLDCLADPTRLRLLRLLDRHELGVVELCDILQLPQSTISRHLKILSDRHFLRHRRLGATHLYRMILDELDPSARRLWLLARDQSDAWATSHQDHLRLERLLRQKETDSQTFFAGAAAQWDKLRTELYGQTFTQSALAALLPADAIIADLGCGTGPLIAQIAPHVRQVIGIDNSAPMLKAARKRLQGMDNIDLRRGDLAALPIPDQTCDAALLILALTYIPDPAPVLRETHRILKPHGKAVVVDLLPHDRDDFRRQLGQHHPGFSPDTLNNLLQASLFANPRITPLPPEPAAKGPALFLATGNRLSVDHATERGGT